MPLAMRGIRLMARFQIVFDDGKMELLQDIEKQMQPFKYPSGMEPACAKLGAQIALSWLAEKKRAEGSRSMDETKKSDQIDSLRWVGDSMITLRVAVMSDNPDVNVDDLSDLLDKICPPLSEFMEASFGEGDDG